MSISQGCVYLANLNPAKGSEQSGKRPVVVVSGNTMNITMPVCIVCPITSSIKNYHSCTIVRKNKTNGLTHDSEVLTFQIRTVSKRKLIKKLGKINSIQMEQVRAGIHDVLLF